MKEIQVTVKSGGIDVPPKEQRIIIDKIMELKNLFGTKIEINFT